MDIYNKIIGILVVLFFIFLPLLQRVLMRKRAAAINKPTSEKIERPRKRPPVVPMHVDQTTDRLMKEGEYAFTPHLDEFSSENTIEKRELAVHVNPTFREDVTSSAFRSVIARKVVTKQRLSEEQKMIIYHEIMKRADEYPQ